MLIIFPEKFTSTPLVNFTSKVCSHKRILCAYASDETTQVKCEVWKCGIYCADDIFTNTGLQPIGVEYNDHFNYDS